MKRVLLLAIGLWAGSVSARPVAFLDATSLMYEFDKAAGELMLHRTLSPRFAVGADYLRVSGATDPAHFVFLTFNALLLRQNREGSQANFYLLSGAGMRHATEAGFAAFGGAQADYETRRLYTSLAGRLVRANSETAHEVTARVGLAPYVAEMQGLHAWIFGQVQHETWHGRTRVGPVLRLFYENLLLELGVSFDGGASLGLTTEL